MEDNQLNDLRSSDQVCIRPQERPVFCLHSAGSHSLESDRGQQTSTMGCDFRMTYHNSLDVHASLRLDGGRQRMAPNLP